MSQFIFFLDDRTPCLHLCLLNASLVSGSHMMHRFPLNSICQLPLVAESSPSDFLQPHTVLVSKVFEATWNKDYISSVEITFKEDLGTLSTNNLVISCHSDFTCSRVKANHKFSLHCAALVILTQHVSSQVDISK